MALADVNEAAVRAAADNSLVVSGGKAIGFRCDVIASLEGKKP